MPTTLPPRQPAPADAPRPSAWRGVQGVILVLSLAVLGVLVLLPLWGSQAGRGRPWSVAITAPAVLAAGDVGERRLELLVEALADTADRALASRTGLVASRTDQAAASDREAAAIAREADADEALTLTFDCRSKRCTIGLRRVRAVDASLEWRRSFRVSTDDLFEVDAEVSSELHLAYLKFKRRQGGARLHCPPQVYQTYLATLADHRRGRLGAPRAAEALSQLHLEAPRFFGPYLHEAALRAEPEDEEAWRRAAELLREAARIAPDDVRAPLRLVPILLKLEENREAVVALRVLEALAPGDPRVEDWRRHADESVAPEVVPSAEDSRGAP